MNSSRIVAALSLALACIAPLAAQPKPAAPVAAPAPAFEPTRFTVSDQGTAGKPDLLLIPGMSSSRMVWSTESILLAPNYRLHLVQINGFAGTLAGPNAKGPVLAPVVEELHAYIAANKMHPVVIGHSMGGLITLMLASKHPEDARKIVIVDALPFAAVLIDPAATALSIKPQVEAIKQQMLALPLDQYIAMQPLAAARMVKDPVAQKALAASFAASERGVAVEAMEEDLETDLRADVASIKTPALVFYACDPAAQQPDQATYEGIVRASYMVMPNVVVKRIDDSRHFIMYDQPQKFDAALEEFLK